MNVIAITTYQRPEFLKIYLLQLLKNKEITNYAIHFFVDVNYHPDVDIVIDWFSSIVGKDKIKVTYRTTKPSACPATFNIMDSYLVAAEYASEYIILGEEDIIPSPDYLRFVDYTYHNYLKKYKKIFCVAHKRRPEISKSGDPSLLIGDTQCTSPICVSVEAIKKYIKPVITTPGFYENPILFNKQYFNKSRIPYHDHYDHDGQIERIIEFYGLFALKPDQTRSAHIGFYGGNKIDEKIKNQNLDEKVEFLKEVIFNEEKIKALCKDMYESSNQTEVATCNLENYVWSDLYLDLDRDKAKASSWWYDPQNNFKKYILSHE